MFCVYEENLTMKIVPLSVSLATGIEVAPFVTERA